MEKAKLDIEGLTEIPVRQLSKFLRFIAERNLWDELEQHLTEYGCDKLLISFEPIQAIGAIVETKSRELASKQSGASTASAQESTLLRCGCNGPLGPRPGPVTPGTPDGGTRPRSAAWFAVRVDTLVERSLARDSEP